MLRITLLAAALVASACASPTAPTAHPRASAAAHPVRDTWCTDNPDGYTIIGTCADGGYLVTSG